jgi:tRNA (guanine-N7-)-methyltransferase
LRQGRVSRAQAQAHATLLPSYGIEYKKEMIDFVALFGRPAETILEIGFGMGETTAAIAAAQPDKNFLGIEVHTPGVGSLLKRIGELGLANLRLIQHDAVEVLHDMIPPTSLDGVHIFFPDPWPKKRHHKRRLVQADFVALLASRLKPGGYVHLATDWQDYAEQMLAVLAAEPLLANTAAGFAARPAYRPQTKFESRGLNLGHGVWDIVFRKR